MRDTETTLTSEEQNKFNEFILANRERITRYLEAVDRYDYLTPCSFSEWEKKEASV